MMNMNDERRIEELERAIQEIKQSTSCLAQNAELLKAGKLVLLVDLDNTLVYTSNTMERDIPGVKDVVRYQLGGGDKSWMFTRLRPHVKQFLHNISPLFEIRICTMGNRQYDGKRWPICSMTTLSISPTTRSYRERTSPAGRRPNFFESSFLTVITRWSSSTTGRTSGTRPPI